MILHVMHNDKFILPFISFINKHFDKTKHKFIIINNSDNSQLANIENVEFRNSDEELNNIVLNYMKSSQKIILHGLFRPRINDILYKNEKLLKKSYWVMWGGDFYFPEKQNKIQHFIIKNVAYLVTGTDGEVEYVKKHYNAKGKHIKAFVYTSNLYKETNIEIKNNNTINIITGNSSTPTNQHKEIFNTLLKYKNKNIKIYTPLSYGDFKYGMEVMKNGYELFGDKFNPLIDLIPEKEYYQFLSSIDIGIFYQNRQQGMGNIITLLGMGKKVYMNPEISTFKMLQNLGVKVYDFNNFDLKKIDIKISESNKRIIKENFSEEVFINDLKNIFNNKKGD